MEIFSALLAICAGNSPVPGEFPAQRPVRRSFDVFFDLRPNKQLNKQWWGWWFETPSWSSWRHRHGIFTKINGIRLIQAIGNQCYSFRMHPIVPCKANERQPQPPLISWQPSHQGKKMNSTYRKISDISRTKSQNLNVSRLGLQLPLCNIVKPSVKWRMKM